MLRVWQKRGFSLTDHPVFFCQKMRVNVDFWAYIVIARQSLARKSEICSAKTALIGQPASAEVVDLFANLRFALRLGSPTLACSPIRPFAKLCFAQLRSYALHPTRHHTKFTNIITKTRKRKIRWMRMYTVPFPVSQGKALLTSLSSCSAEGVLNEPAPPSQD